jgi:2-polyprenyl-3-methyl-5-hydroxy-6-metoxy-1,4-benzoquinol methylase
MKRTAQLGYSAIHSDVYFGQGNRERKALTIVAILQDYLGEKLKQSNILDVGASTGYIDNVLADFSASVEGLDIDEGAINFANETFNKKNLTFKSSDALDLNYEDDSFDVIICNHVYEHVIDDKVLMSEIYRVLKKSGVCFFTAGNRNCLVEPHYKLPLLSVMPRALAHIYMRIMKKGSFYHEKHRSYWGLRKLVKDFSYKDYTKEIVSKPQIYKVDYMIRQGSFKQRVAISICKYFFWLCPTYVWVLKK